MALRETADTLVSIAYVHGLGRARAALSTNGDGTNAWVRSGKVAAWTSTSKAAAQSASSQVTMAVKRASGRSMKRRPCTRRQTAKQVRS